MTLRYIPHIVLSLAITSLSVHLLVHRKTAEAQRAHLTAQISILESIAQQLKSDKPLHDDELERLKRLVRTHEEHPPSVQVLKDTVGWKDVFFGTKRPEAVGDLSKWDRKDLDKARQEIEKSL